LRIAFLIISIDNKTAAEQFTNEIYYATIFVILPINITYCYMELRD
jgi:hypothetical protein